MSILVVRYDVVFGIKAAGRRVSLNSCGQLTDNQHFLPVSVEVRLIPGGRHCSTFSHVVIVPHSCLGAAAVACELNGRNSRGSALLRASLVMRN